MSPKCGPIRRQSTSALFWAMVGRIFCGFDLDMPQPQLGSPRQKLSTSHLNGGAPRAHERRRSEDTGEEEKREGAP